MSQLINDLRARGISNVEAEFHGCGDEGSVQAVTLIRRVQPPGGTPGWVEAREDLHASDPLWEAIDTLCSEHAEYDWWNNEGGHGTATIDVAAGTVTFDRNVYVEHSESLDELTKAVP